jgi:NAD(P)-dependent dehydrogenase (short-subunit alcohol dehydrogenase family)
MKIEGHSAVVTGGGSGLGEAVARELARQGARVAVLDINAANAARVAGEIGGLACACDITDTASVSAALDAAEAAHGTRAHGDEHRRHRHRQARGGQGRHPAPLEDFERVVRINLVGTYNVVRLTAARLLKLAPLEDGERGVMLMTASVAAYDGQVGQEAYAASKGGIVSMTLPLARDLAQFGIRVCSVAPGLFATPLMQQLPPEVQQSLAASIPFPRRLGAPGGVCIAGRAHRDQWAPQRRGHPPGRRAAHGAAMSGSYTYRAPLRDMRFVLERVLQAPASWAACPAFAELDADTAAAVLEEAARFASEVLQPLNAVGDREGCTLQADGVHTPAGFAATYAAFVQGGWPALPCSPEWGGQGLPLLVDAALREMLAPATTPGTCTPTCCTAPTRRSRPTPATTFKARYLGGVASGESWPPWP